MTVFTWSIRRGMFLMACIAVGLTAMKTQADFWLGMFCGMLLIEFSRSVVELAASPPGGRSRSLLYLGSLAGCLIVGFSPWSDREFRSDLTRYGGANSWIRVLDPSEPRQGLDAWPTTWLFLRILPWVDPHDRTTVRTYDAADRLVLSIQIQAQAMGEQTDVGLTPQLLSKIREDITFFSSFHPEAHVRMVAEPTNLAGYLDACYLMLALGVACLTRAILGLSGLIAGSRRSRENSASAATSPAIG